MPDREYVIKCLKYLHDRETWKEGPLVYDDQAADRRQITADALALLREQEPVNARVLTPDEYAEWCLGEENRNEKQNSWKPKTPLLIEKRREKRRENVMYWLNAPEMVVHIDKEYGKTFIVWTGYPTKEQREKVKWDER